MFVSLSSTKEVPIIDDEEGIKIEKEEVTVEEESPEFEKPVIFLLLWAIKVDFFESCTTTVFSLDIVTVVGVASKLVK